MSIFPAKSLRCTNIVLLPQLCDRATYCTISINSVQIGKFFENAKFPNLDRIDRNGTVGTEGRKFACWYISEVNDTQIYKYIICISTVYFSHYCVSIDLS